MSEDHLLLPQQMDALRPHRGTDSAQAAVAHNMELSMKKVAMNPERTKLRRRLAVALVLGAFLGPMAGEAVASQTNFTTRPAGIKRLDNFYPTPSSCTRVDTDVFSGYPATYSWDMKFNQSWAPDTTVRLANGLQFQWGRWYDGYYNSTRGAGYHFDVSTPNADASYNGDIFFRC